MMVGRTLLEPVLALAGWAKKNRRRVQRARDQYDARPITRPQAEL
jgi:DNA-binding HxlR family transcriptional regulator